MRQVECRQSLQKPESVPSHSSQEGGPTQKYDISEKIPKPGLEQQLSCLLDV